jgi:hypothetical protein
MAYIPEESKVSYQSKDGKEEKVFDALEWVAAMCSHVPNIVIPFPLTHKPNFVILHPRKSNVLSSNFQAREVHYEDAHRQPVG